MWSSKIFKETSLLIIFIFAATTYCLPTTRLPETPSMKTQETGVVTERKGLKTTEGQKERKKPMCQGLLNVGNGLVKRFATSGGWSKKTLTYSIMSYPSRTTELGGRQAVEGIIETAFKDWSGVANLHFQRLSNDQKADIVIDFANRDHGDWVPFDGPGGIYAHAYGPRDGRLHFDDDELWTHNTPSGINLRQVATHEIGHVLDLKHSDISASTMFNYYHYEEPFALHADDIAGIQSIYGKKDEMVSEPKQEIPPVAKLPLTPPASLTTQQTIYDAKWWNWFWYSRS